MESVRILPLGRIVATPEVLMTVSAGELIEALTRHKTGDWGEICVEDWQINDEALEKGFRILSSYTSTKGVKFWIITEHDRSVTTVLLPDEY